MDLKTKDKLISTAKYGGSSVTIGASIVEILMFMFPNLEPIQGAIYALIIFAVNLVIVYSGILKEEELG